MKGFVPTPNNVVDSIVDQLFKNYPPSPNLRLLDPGCGHGAFISGVLRWCANRNIPGPTIFGIDSDPNKIKQARRDLGRHPRVSLLRGDFLTARLESFDFIVGNPPYVPIEELSESERKEYRSRYLTASGRLDLYLLFWERSLDLLRANGRIVFITPEKFTYVETARPLRILMAGCQIESINFAPEDTFPGLTTYPVITSVRGRRSDRKTRVQLRNGQRSQVSLPKDGESWQGTIKGSPKLSGRATLVDISGRISCGVATGADSVFLFSDRTLPHELKRFAHPTIGGRDLTLGEPRLSTNRQLVIPYDSNGGLIPLSALGSLRSYLKRPANRAKLLQRSCVRHKPWHSFHETPPLAQMLRPKILCKDISSRPYFWLDSIGDIVPLHSVYYIVPKSSNMLDSLLKYLNSEDVANWLRANCQAAANGFLRIQSTILKKLPVSDELLRANEVHSLHT